MVMVMTPEELREYIRSMPENEILRIMVEQRKDEQQGNVRK